MTNDPIPASITDRVRRVLNDVADSYDNVYAFANAAIGQSAGLTPFEVQWALQYLRRRGEWATARSCPLLSRDPAQDGRPLRRGCVLVRVRSPVHQPTSPAQGAVDLHPVPDGLGHVDRP